TQAAAEGWHFVEWQSETVTVTDNTFVMPEGNVTVTAVFEKDETPEPTPEPGDVITTLLKDVYDKAVAQDYSNLIDSAKAYYENALAQAEAILDNPSAYTQEQVEEATDQLFIAVAMLDWVKGDPAMLQLLVERGDQMMANADKYVETNWQQLVGALDAAKKTLADASDSMQYEMDKVSEVLLEAILAQRYKADKSILEGLLAEAETVDTTGASEVAVATFRTALATARAVMADATLSVDDQAKVDEAAAALKAAMDGLTAGGAPETTDKPEASEKPESTDKPQATEKPAEKPAQTGDSAQLMLYVAALGAAVVA
ncbi:hypothetical protein B5F12_11610, partial [Pseudoflavonifractor sp. An176]